MKNSITLFLFILSLLSVQSQEKIKDTTKLERLDEVLITAIRVNAESPITFSNIYKEDLNERNLGQDIPVLMNFLPNVVTHQMLVVELDIREFVFVVVMQLV